MLCVWNWRGVSAIPRHLRMGLGARIRTVSNMRASEIRKRYAEYFERNGHTRLASADIVPQNDPTLLFTNAGMVPFKQYFLRPDTAPYKMITTAQKCVRAGGKHNDLDQVGYTPRHHTFFEMLGNFSFGAYDKQEVIRMAWRFVREELQLPTNRLRVTVLDSDHETYEIWRDQIKLDPQQIVRCGEDDNFWSMGNEGPCGPCTEIFWDTCDTRYAADDERRWLEFWNLVFMQFHRSSDGTLTPLSTPCVDTGMGLERIASIVQGKTNNFDTDEFQIIIRGVNQLQRNTQTSVDAQTEVAYKRIVADHLRASAFLVSEGVNPSNTGRGYVLRRIIRRAVRAGRLLGIDGPVLPALYASLEAAMGSAYPELTERRDSVIAVLQAEESAFAKTLDKGMSLLTRIFHSDAAAKIVSAQDTFALYDTHGFPVDLTQIIARDHGWTVDVDGFNTIQAKSRERNRASWKSGATRTQISDEISSKMAEWQADGVSTRFCGYEIDPEQTLAEQHSRVVASSVLSNGDALIVVEPCPFYARGGGQEPDAGTVTVSAVDCTEAPRTLDVKHAVALPNGRATALCVDAQHAELRVGQPVVAAIDMQRRRGCAVHHTATHLLHAALRQVMGDTVTQAGSLVRPDSLRFDFTSIALSDVQLREVERLVNRFALASTPVNVTHTTLEAAKEQGAMALFTEKYQAENVRMVNVPSVSVELCSGTHLRTTRGVFPFQITSESSVGAGTRRIDAVAGVAASEWLQQQLEYAQNAAHMLNTKQLSKLGDAVQRLSDSNKALRSDASQWLRVAAVNAQAVATHATTLGANISTVIHILAPEPSAPHTGDARLVAERACHLRDTQSQTVHVVIQGTAIALAVNPACFPTVQAGTLLRELLSKLPGKGGGQGVLAQGRLKSAVTGIHMLPL
ncbi:hypothetical protein GGF49_003042 [Coemansia sp. RSA 1853]|nr:hypothetical protein GGF49_003042 [Coemansia sp. RSA 1853]